MATRDSRSIAVIPVTAGAAILAAAAFLPGARAQEPGQAIYLKACVACHGGDGTGAFPGVPDFAEGGRLKQPEDVLVQRVMDGFQSPGASMAMPPKGGYPDLTEADARAVVRYLVGAFGRR